MQLAPTCSYAVRKANGYFIDNSQSHEHLSRLLVLFCAGVFVTCLNRWFLHALSLGARLIWHAEQFQK